MHTNHELVDHLRKTGLAAEHESAFLAVDRKKFVLDVHKDEAYGDYPLRIGYGQTISQPTTVAIMLAMLAPENGMRVLDVGCGSGYTMALLSEIVGLTGMVFGVERIPQLVTYCQAKISERKNCVVHQATDPLGWKSGAPYDRILVSAAAADVPGELIDQLRPGGVLVLPVKNTLCRLTKEISGSISTEERIGFSFVPLIQSGE